MTQTTGARGSAGAAPGTAVPELKPQSADPRTANAESQTIFLLSPAHCGGKRAQILLREQAQFDLALRLRETGASIGEIFSFLSGLYFRGKLAYATSFARARNGHGVLVITPGHGLVEPERVFTHDALRGIADIGVALEERRYREPLERDASALATQLGPSDVVVLLGSIATDKYVEVLQQGLGSRLRFPIEFVGRGDMSRGGLMLRCVLQGRELDYQPIEGATRRGSRPPRLEPIR